MRIGGIVIVTVQDRPDDKDGTRHAGCGDCCFLREMRNNRCHDVHDIERSNGNPPCYIGDHHYEVVL